MTQSSAPNGAVQNTSYDSYVRVLQTTAATGAVTDYVYTNSPPTVKATTNGHWVKTTYDGLGRTIKVEQGDATSTKSIVDTEYEPCACSPIGKMKRVSQPYAPGGTIYWTTYTYDALGRTVSVAHADGLSTTTSSYSGNTVTTTDPAGKWKTVETDALGNAVKTIEPNPAGGANLDTTFTYNLLNQMTQAQMTRNSITQTRTWSYNLTNGRLNSETHPESGTTSYTYNGDGTLATKSLANGKVLTFGYDWLGRLISVSDPSSNGCGGSNYQYDDASSLALGRIWKITYGGESCAAVPYQFNEEYDYTAAGQVTLKNLYLAQPSIQWTSATMGVGYAYGNEGQVTAMSAPSVYYDYAYDSMMRPLSMGGNASVSNVTYNVAGQMLTMTHSGLQETRQYNVMGQTTRITVPGQMDLEYRYSTSQNNGQATSMKNWISGEKVNYSYDALLRLTAAATTGPEWGLSFTFDGFGNKTAQTVTKGTGPSMSIGVDANNRVVGHNYDAAGFTTSIPGTFTNLSWDGLGRMTSASVTSGPTDNYIYDANNLRVWKNNQLYLRGAGGEMVGQYSFNPSTKTFAFVQRWGYFAGRVVGQKEDEIGTVQTGSRFYPYGEESPATGQDKTKFATYYRDSGTNLDYAQQRYYASSLGRFISPDPAGIKAGWNPYSYADGDPVNWNDPEGLAPCGTLVPYTADRRYRSVRDVMLAYDDFSYLALVTWHEAGPIYTSDRSNMDAFRREQGLIASALLNRWDIANGRMVAYDTSGRLTRMRFGGVDSSLKNVILEAAGNNQSWGMFQNNLLRTTNFPTGAKAPKALLENNLDQQHSSLECEAILSAIAHVDLLINIQKGFRYGFPSIPMGYPTVVLFWNKWRSPGVPTGIPQNLFNFGRVRSVGNTWFGYDLVPPPAGPPAVRPPSGGRGR